MIRVDNSVPTAPYEQIRMQLTDQIRSGSLASGTRLPSVRQLAGDLKIAPGTVVRAYAELEKAGLITTSRTGTRVAPTDPIADPLLSAAAAFLADGRARTLEEALQAVRIQWTIQHG